MKERPILFNGEMVRAILAGRKTQTRRVMKPQPEQCIDDSWMWASAQCQSMIEVGACHGLAPLGKPGDRLWVRESWAVSRIYDAVKPSLVDPGAKVAYAANNPVGLKGRPSIFMPRWASRIDLEISGVRVERIRHMTMHDWQRDFAPNYAEQENARATSTGSTFQREHSRKLWDSVAPPEHSWDANPWVWVYEFRLV